VWWPFPSRFSFSGSLPTPPPSPGCPPFSRSKSFVRQPFFNRPLTLPTPLPYPRPCVRPRYLFLFRVHLRIVFWRCFRCFLSFSNPPPLPPPEYGRPNWASDFFPWMSFAAVLCFIPFSSIFPSVLFLFFPPPGSFVKFCRFFSRFLFVGFFFWFFFFF